MTSSDTHDVPDLKALPAAVWHIEGRQDRGRTMPWGTLVIAPPDGCERAVISPVERTIDENTFFVGPWYDDRENIYDVRVEPGVVAAERLDGLFRGCLHLWRAKLGALDVSRTKSMRNLFSGCYALEKVYTEGWDTAQLEDAHRMFRNCKKLTSAPVGHWDTGSLRNASALFLGCERLRKADLSGWDTACLDDVEAMFGCTALYSLNLDGWDEEVKARLMSDLATRGARTLQAATWDISLDRTTSLVTLTVRPPVGCDRACLRLAYGGDYRYYYHHYPLWYNERTRIQRVRFEPGVIAPPYLDNLFSGYRRLQEADLSNLDMGAVTSIYHLFGDCPALTTVDFGAWSASGIVDLKGAFRGCESLTSIDLSGWDVSSVVNLAGMFDGCRGLSTLNLSGWHLTRDDGYGIKASDMLRFCIRLSKIVLDGCDPKTKRIILEEYRSSRLT